MSGSQPVTRFTGCHRDTTAGCHGEVLDWVPVGVNNHQVSAKKRGGSSERLAAVISGRVVSAVVSRPVPGEQECRLDCDCWVRASSRISMDTTYSVCPFWSQNNPYAFAKTPASPRCYPYCS